MAGKETYLNTGRKRGIIVKKKMLIYANYYTPDVASVGQIIRELSEGLLDTFDITIICAVPSYTGVIAPEYKTRRYYREIINGVHVLRIRVPEYDKHNTLSRVKNILSYFLGAMIATFKVGQQDYVFSISQPPVLGGLLGVWGKLVRRAKFIYNIQDFNPEQIMAVNYSKNRILIKMLMSLDKFSCKQSDLIVTVGRDLVETLENRFQDTKVPKVAMINNWTDERLIFPLSSEDTHVVNFKKQYDLVNKFVVMYSGNIGLYYDLKNIIKVIRKFPIGTKSADGREVQFVFVGEGAVLKDLQDYVTNHEMKNVSFIPYQPKGDLIYSLNAADVHWCVNAKGIKGVSCPSKFYGIAAAGKPVLAVLEHGSEVERLIREAHSGLIAEPGDYLGIESNLRGLLSGNVNLVEMGDANRQLVVTKLTKTISVESYRKAILSL